VLLVKISQPILGDFRSNARIVPNSERSRVTASIVVEHLHVGRPILIIGSTVKNMPA
jgi:hypothetical protein